MKICWSCVLWGRVFRCVVWCRICRWIGKNTLGFKLFFDVDIVAFLNNRMNFGAISFTTKYYFMPMKNIDQKSILSIIFSLFGKF